MFLATPIQYSNQDKMSTLKMQIYNKKDKQDNISS